MMDLRRSGRADFGGRPFGSVKGKGWFMRGSNFRMKHYQAAILLAQFDKLQKETEHRWANADYLSAGGSIPVL